MVYPLTLFPSNATDFTTNGLGSLGDAVSCTVTEEANGSFELEMEYPIDGIHFSDIGYRSIIFSKANSYGKPQAFRIYKISKPMNGIVVYYAAHISYDLSGVTLEPWEANSCKEVFAGIPTHSVGLEKFTFWTDVEATGYFWQLNPVSLRNALGGDEGCVLALYGGEYEFDNYEVKLHSHRGENYGTKIIYGKNLTDITQEENCSSVYSAVYPYWSNDSDETLITLPEKTVPALGNHDFVNILTLDLSSELEDEPSEEELREAAKNYIELNQIGIPSISIDVSFIQLEQTEEYKYLEAYEHIELFDTVEVEFPKLGVSSTARVVTTVYDALGDKYQSITLGDSRMRASDTIADQGLAAMSSINNVSVSVNKNIEQSNSELSEKIENSTGWFTNGLGYVQAVRNAAGNWEYIYILDQPDMQKAVNVLRFGRNGLEYSSTGVGGSYVSVMSQRGMLQAPRMDVDDTQRLTGASTSSLQGFLDEIAKRIATELVTSTDLTNSLMNYVTEAALTNELLGYVPTTSVTGENVNNNKTIPTSSVVYQTWDSVIKRLGRIYGIDTLVMTGSNTADTLKTNILNYINLALDKQNRSYIVMDLEISNGISGVLDGGYTYGYLFGTINRAKGKAQASLIYLSHKPSYEVSIVLIVDNVFRKFFDPVVLSSGLAGINSAVNRFQYRYVSGLSTCAFRLNSSAVSGGRVYVNMSGVDGDGFTSGVEIGYVSKQWLDLGTRTHYKLAYSMNETSIIADADINTDTSVLTLTFTRAIYQRVFIIELV